MATTIRKLRISDRNDIIEISRHVWEGHDYLPSVADQWLNDPNSHFCGIEVGSHVVAVGNLRIIEDGRTGWMEGLRVHPDCRGKGLAKEITRYLVEKAERMGVERLRYTTSNRNEASLKLAKMAGFSKILEMAVGWHLKPKPIAAFGDYPPIRKRSPKRTCSLLKANSRIIPHGILTYEWKALDNTCRNIEEISKTHAFYIALKEKKVDSLSFGSPMQEPNETGWGFTIYATNSLGFLSQLSHNVKLALKHDIGSIICIFETKFEKTLNRVNLRSKEHEGARLVLLEKRLRTKK
jgi:N-acetylglutamate synthase-like GNAT family acetyltransferase